MRILFVSARAAAPERRAVVRTLAGRDIDLVLAVPERTLDADGRVVRTAAGTDGRLRLAPVPVRGPLDGDAAPRWHAGTLRRLVRDTRPDLLHIEREPWSPAARAAAAAARALGVPFALHVSQPVAEPLGWIDRWRTGRLLREARGLAAASTPALALWRDALPPDAVTAVVADQPTPVPPRLPAPPRDALTIGYAGRLVPERGCDLLLRACVQLLGPWSLRIAGTGPSQEELEALAARLGIAARIQWLGGLPADARDALWDDVDVLVLPARTTPTWVEPAALLLREAMARHVAAVGTRSGAIPDVLGPDGLLVAEEDPAAIAAVLQRLADDPGALAAARDAARRRIVDAFTPDAIADRLAAWWQTMLTKR